MSSCTADLGSWIEFWSPHHQSYDPLFYVLLFPQDENVYELALRQRNGRTLTPGYFYTYCIQVRRCDNNLFMKKHRLMQQYTNDRLAENEGSRLNWAIHYQGPIGAKKFKGLINALEAGDAHRAGCTIVPTATVCGSPRFYNEPQQNKICNFHQYGKPDYFLTFTTSPTWPEVRCLLNDGDGVQDRSDVCAWVFKAKLDTSMVDILKNDVLGKVIANSGTIEWQKTGCYSFTHFAIIGKLKQATFVWRHQQNCFSWAARPSCKPETLRYRCANYVVRALAKSQPHLCLYGRNRRSINLLKKLPKRF